MGKENFINTGASDFKLMKPEVSFKFELPKKQVELHPYTLLETVPLITTGELELPEYPDSSFYTQIRGDTVVIRQKPLTVRHSNRDDLSVEWQSGDQEDPIVATYVIDEGWFELEPE